MIGTLWEMREPEVNPWIYLVVEKSSLHTWKLLELVSGSIEHGWQRVEDEQMMKLVGTTAEIYPFTLSAHTSIYPFRP